MTFITDFSLINAASAQGDFTFGDFEPTDNTSASTSPNYIEGVSCQFWPLKKGVTDGYAYLTGPLNADTDGRLTVGWHCQLFADIDNIPITALGLQLSGSTTWPAGSPYARWDALGQIAAPLNAPISGHTPIMVYPTNPDASAGTVTYTDVDYIGWVASTGNNNDGKQGWFDMFFNIGWVGFHSETRTNDFFDELYEQAFDSNGGGVPGTTSRPLGVVGRNGDSFVFNVNIQMGDGTSDTANIVVSETGKTIFFSNVEPEHGLGYLFVNPASTNELRFTLTDCVHFWSSQLTTHDVFTTPNNADWFRVTGCSFANGGAVELPTHTTNRWTRSTKFDNCGEIDVGDHDFDGNTITNATSGTFYPVTGTLRAKNNNYTNCTDAIRLTGTGPVTVVLDGDTFSGNTDDIHWAGTGQLTVQNTNGANATSSRVSGGGTVVFETTVPVLVTGVTEGTSVKIIAQETVGAVTSGDILVEEFADSLGQVSFNHNYEGDLDILIRARNHGITVAAIADDGGVQTDETTNANSFATNDMNILPATPVANDAYYFGAAESFSRLKLDISDVNGTGSTITWEYWNGAWTALSGVVDGTSNFENSGENIVSWTVPGDWATTTVNSQGPLLYVRARLSTLGSANQTRARKCTLDTTRYLPFVQNNTIASTGVIVIAVWVPDTISKFDPFE